MIALVRHIGIPCRYVSGYLYHGKEDHDRSISDATHAWVEALLPALDGSASIDECSDAATVISRTAARARLRRCPSNEGIFRGRTDSELYVAVKVTASAEPPPLDQDLPSRKTVHAGRESASASASGRTANCRFSRPNNSSSKS